MTARTTAQRGVTTTVCPSMRSQSAKAMAPRQWTRPRPVGRRTPPPSARLEKGCTLLRRFPVRTRTRRAPCRHRVGPSNPPVAGARERTPVNGPRLRIWLYPTVVSFFNNYPHTRKAAVLLMYTDTGRILIVLLKVTYLNLTFIGYTTTTLLPTHTHSLFLRNRPAGTLPPPAWWTWWQPRRRPRRACCKVKTCHASLITSNSPLFLNLILSQFVLPPERYRLYASMFDGSNL